MGSASSVSEDVLVNNGVELLLAVAVIENCLPEQSSQLECAEGKNLDYLRSRGHRVCPVEILPEKTV